MNVNGKNQGQYYEKVRVAWRWTECNETTLVHKYFLPQLPVLTLWRHMACTAESHDNCQPQQPGIHRLRRLYLYTLTHVEKH